MVILVSERPISKFVTFYVVLCSFTLSSFFWSKGVSLPCQDVFLPIYWLVELTLFGLYRLLCKLWSIHGNHSCLVFVWSSNQKLNLHANWVVGLAADSTSESKSPSKRRDLYSEDAISFSEVDIITPAQKMLARQLTCDIVPGESLLVTG